MQSAQKGEGALSLMASVVFVIACLLWGLSDYLPADANDLQEVISLAEASPEATSELQASLKQTPSPSRSELRHIRSRVNEIVVTKTVREVTGDKTIQSPSERAAARERQAVARLAEIESKPWTAMSTDERAEFLAGYISKGIGILILAALLTFGLRAMHQAERGH